MKQSFSFKGLPHGTGAAMGNFIRAIYMTASTRPAIVGISINDLHFFDRIPNNSVMVSDIVSGIISKEYAIDASVLTDERLVGVSDLGEVWALTVHTPQVKTLSTEHFSGIMTIPSCDLATFVAPVDIVTTFYVMQVCGVRSDVVSSACLQEVLKDRYNLVGPLACSGQRGMRCWHNICTNKFTEDLEVFMEGDDRTFDADFKHLKATLAEYLGRIHNTVIM